LIAAALLAGCATESERPTQEMARAQTLIDQAEKAGAQRYAAAQLEQARAKLDEAQAADRKGKHDDAQQRATEAAADAELAVAMANSGEAQRAAADVQQSVDTLRDEAQRSSAINSSNLNESISNDPNLQ
jgi:macrodomain Ter protein organizer (MatP/YcbG family)